MQRCTSSENMGKEKFSEVLSLLVPSDPASVDPDSLVHVDDV